MIANVERMSDSPDQRPDLRISDTDRDRAAEVLREAHAEGRITVDELGGTAIVRLIVLAMRENS
jgi:uncharacterized membrane protein